MQWNFHNFDRGAMLMELLPYLDMMTSIHLSMEVPKSVSLDYVMWNDVPLSGKVDDFISDGVTPLDIRSKLLYSSKEVGTMFLFK